MRNILKRFLLTYPGRSYIRTLIKVLPKGAALDFLLVSKASPKKSTVPWGADDRMRIFEKIKHRLNDSQEIGKNLKVRKGPARHPPELMNLGQYNLDKKTQKTSNRIKRSLQDNNRPNDPCAVLIKDPDWKDEPLHLLYHTLFYSDIRALRKENIRPTIISANALLFSEEERCILVHRRSQESDDFPYTLHTFGGAFMPHGIGGRGDIAGLKECVTREIHEETGLSVFISEFTPIVTIDEFKIDFVHISYLGVNISTDQMNDLRPNWEGTITKIPFDDLHKWLDNFQEWTITGWVDVVLWLSLDTPNASKSISFAGKSAEDLCKSVLRNLTIGQARCICIFCI